MEIKKFITTTTLTLAALFAVTVPSAFAKCPCEQDITPSEIQCEKGCPLDVVAPCNSNCAKSSALQPECGCEREITTGAASPVCDINKMTKQDYAYPNSVYSNANVSISGDSKDAAILSDKMGLSKGVFVENSDCATGFATPILGSDCIDKLNFNAPCPCTKNNNDHNMVQSPTSIEVTKKLIEPLKSSMTGAASGLSQFYPDVPNGYFAAPEIDRLTEQCILAGYPDGKFRPSKSITRAEVASSIVKGYNLEDSALSSKGDFIDVPQSHWAYEAINRAATNDFLAGCDCGKFKPNKNITMTEALTVISKGVNCPMSSDKANEILSKYPDGNKVPSWARESVAKAIDNGALGNLQNHGMIHPNKNASRAEIASMLQNMRISGGYDSKVRSASGAAPISKTFVQKEQKVKIPTLELTMNDMINSKNANVGEQFAATTINPITIGGTTYRAGSRVNGKIVEVIRPSKNHKGAIKLSFNEIVGCDGQKHKLPKQVLTARVNESKSVNGFARLIQMPFTWTGSLIGNTGRTVGGMLIGLTNATENVFDTFGTGSSELLTGQFKASGRSYQDSLKAAVKAPVDLTRTALSGTMGLFQTTGDEIAYLVDYNGFPLSQVNPKQKITIAFGE